MENLEISGYCVEIKDIFEGSVKLWMLEHGYDGLWNGGDETCGCSGDGLFACLNKDDEIPTECVLGHLVGGLMFPGPRGLYEITMIMALIWILMGACPSLPDPGEGE